MGYIGSKPADKALTSDDITDGVISTAKIQDNAVTTAKTSYSDAPFRNIIINGDMSIAQRGTSTASITSTGYYTVDRWNMNIATGGTWTQSQDTSVPTGQGFATSLKMACTTANASLSAGSYFSLRQKFEGQMLQYLKKGTANAQSLTASFWIKSNKTGTYCVMLYDADNTRAISKTISINSADTWEKKTLTYAGDTTGVLGNDNAYSFALELILLAGTNYTSGTQATSWESYTSANVAPNQTVNLADSTSNYINITGVQLEVGSAASDFEFLPYDVNLQRCQRYFYKLIDVPSGDAGGYFASGYMYNSSSVYSWNEFPTMMRAAPTLSVASGTNYYIFYRASTADNLDDFYLGTGRPNGAMIINNTDVSGTAGDAGGIYTTSNSKVTFSAEL